MFPAMHFFFAILLFVFLLRNVIAYLLMRSLVPRVCCAILLHKSCTQSCCAILSHNTGSAIMLRIHATQLCSAFMLRIHATQLCCAIGCAILLRNSLRRASSRFASPFRRAIAQKTLRQKTPFAPPSAAALHPPSKALGRLTGRPTGFGKREAPFWLLPILP